MEVKVIFKVGECKVKGEKWWKYILKFGGSAFDDANCFAYFDHSHHEMFSALCVDIFILLIVKKGFHLLHKCL